MVPLVAASLFNNQLWHLFPLVVAVSLVYGATRHEFIGPILLNAYRFGVWLVGFMAVVFVLLCLMSWNL